MVSTEYFCTGIGSPDALAAATHALQLTPEQRASSRGNPEGDEKPKLAVASLAVIGSLLHYNVRLTLQALEAANITHVRASTRARAFPRAWCGHV